MEKSIEEQLAKADEWLRNRKVGTRKIAEPPNLNSCRDREHLPPTMRVFEAGTYEHICPTCGHRTVFTVPLITL